MHISPWKAYIFYLASAGSNAFVCGSATSRVAMENEDVTTQPAPGLASYAAGLYLPARPAGPRARLGSAARVSP